MGRTGSYVVPDGIRRGRNGGDRTHDLLLPKQARFQLRYIPSVHMIDLSESE